MKFKVGDRVETIENIDRGSRARGTVVKIIKDRVILVWDIFDQEEFSWPEEDLVLIVEGNDVLKTML